MLILVIGFTAWFSLAKPKWVEIYSDPSVIDNSAITKAAVAADIGYGVLVLPILEYKLQHLPLVKQVTIKKVMGGGIQIAIIPEIAKINLINNYILSENNAVVAGKYFAHLPVYDTNLSAAVSVRNWHQKHQVLLAKYPVALREVGYDDVSGQWRVLWADGLLLLLGQTKVATKNLTNWLNLLPYLKRHKFDLAYHIFDIRYPDGFAYSAY